MAPPAPAPPPAFVADRDPEFETGEYELDPELEEPEIPSGTRRAHWGSRSGREGRGGRQPRAHRGLPHRNRAAGAAGAAGGSGRHSRLLRGLAALALIAAAALIWFLIALFQPFHGAGQGSITVRISPHTSASGIGDLLERDGVVSSSTFFNLRALLAGERGNLRSGSYHLRRDMSYGAALDVLTTPPPAAKVTELTIIEGKARSQVSALLHAQGIHGDYLVASRQSRLLNPRAYGAPASTRTLEGFLFPSTYRLLEPISVNALVADQLRAFRRGFAGVNLAHARSKNLTPYDVLTVASLIQGEAQIPRDRALIASVIYNRLHDHMPLQIDATVRYATGNYKSPITVSQLASSSPFNTYTHKGLPPGPINSPGLAAIQAAAHPAGSRYLYFVVKPCANGAHAFASSYTQFLREVNQYRTARNRAGGRSPVSC
ncbi:MAG: endolytic transglycosylase MltG [Solirubrobacteraceae bacterium]